MIYVVLDTSAVIRLWTQSTPGFDMSSVADLAALARNNDIVLLVPEVISLEIEKSKHSEAQSLGDAVGTIKTAITKMANHWNEVDAIKPFLITHCEAWKTQSTKEWEGRRQTVDALFSESFIVRVPLTADILCEAKRKMISGCFTSSPGKDQDALIVQSLITFFQSSKLKDPVLYFCTANERDFAVKVDDTMTFKHRVRDLLPESTVFSDPKSMVDAISTRVVPVQPDPARVQEAEELNSLKDVIADHIAADPAMITNSNLDYWRSDDALSPGFSYQQKLSAVRALSRRLFLSSGFAKSLEGKLDTALLYDIAIKSKSVSDFVLTFPRCHRLGDAAIHFDDADTAIALQLIDNLRRTAALPPLVR